MSFQSSTGRPDQGTPAWLAAPPAETARSALVLVAVWCLSEFVWAAPNLFDHNAATTTVPLPNLIVWVGGLLALLTSLFVGLLAIARSGRLRVVRAVLFAAVLIGGVVASIALVGIKVESSTNQDRHAHAYGVLVIALAVLACAKLLLGVRWGRPRQQTR